MVNNKVWPHDTEAEQVLLSCIIQNPATRGKTKKRLSKETFYDTRHRVIFEAAMADNADLVGIKGSLDMNGLLEKAGGQDYLMQVASKTSTTAEVDSYLEIVLEFFRRRQIMFLSQDVIDQAGTTPSKDLVNKIRKDLQRIQIRDEYGYRTGVDIENVYTAERCLKEYDEYIQTLKQNRFMTGIREVDRRIRGVAGGEVLFIIARAGSFKTALLQNLLKNYIQHSSWGAIFFSIEMPIPSVTERYHEIIQGSTGKDIEQHYSSESAERYKTKLEQDFVKNLKNLFIIPTKVSISDVAAYVRLIEKEHKVKVGVIGIDYLGLLDGSGQGEYEIVSNLARDSKGLAKMLNLPVIMVSQTSRRAGTGDVEISLDMGRGSGAIEESADFVLGLFQAERQGLSVEDDEPKYDLICKILKNRKGPKGSRWKLDLDPTSLRIGPDAEPWEPPKKRRGNDL